MKFLADECCSLALVEALRLDGHDVLYAAELLAGIGDQKILAKAYEENRLLLTEDKDFGEMVYRLRQPARGIILLRFDVRERFEQIPRIRFLLEREHDHLSGRFVVLEPDKIRIRSIIL